MDNLEHEILYKIKKLPTEHLKQALDFIDFLIMKSEQTFESNNQSQSIKEKKDNSYDDYFSGLAMLKGFVKDDEDSYEQTIDSNNYKDYFENLELRN